MLSHGVRLLHSNAPVHSAIVTKEAVKKCVFKELDRPPYSLDLAPSDYNLFSKLKPDIREKTFNDDDNNVKKVVFHMKIENWSSKIHMTK